MPYRISPSLPASPVAVADKRFSVQLCSCLSDLCRAKLLKTKLIVMCFRFAQWLALIRRPLGGYNAVVLKKAGHHAAAFLYLRESSDAGFDQKGNGVLPYTVSLYLLHTGTLPRRNWCSSRANLNSVFLLMPPFFSLLRCTSVWSLSV